MIIFTFSFQAVVLLKAYKRSPVCPLNRHRTCTSLYACFCILCTLEKAKSVEQRSSLIFPSW